MPNGGWRTIKSLVHKKNRLLHVDEGKEWLNPSREKIKARTAERRWMRNQSCVTFLLCDPGWYVQRF